MAIWWLEYLHEKKKVDVYSFEKMIDEILKTVEA